MFFTSTLGPTLRRAQKQRFFVERIFSRDAALEQAVWLRTLVVQRMKKPPVSGGGKNHPVNPPKLIAQLPLVKGP
jgi:hypothetical protein